LKRCGIHWDSLGNSKGTADLEFFKAEDAIKAIEEYHSKLFIFKINLFLEAKINEEEMEVKFHNNNSRNDNTVNGDRRIVIRKNRLGGLKRNFNNKGGITNNSRRRYNN